MLMLQGVVEGPDEFADGLSYGARSLLGHVVGGTAGSVSLISSSLGDLLSNLSFDEDYKKVSSGPLITACCLLDTLPPRKLAETIMLHCHLVTMVPTEHDEIDVLNVIMIPSVSHYCGYCRTCEVYIPIVVMRVMSFIWRKE